MAVASAPRLTAEERRETVIAAATQEFALGGLTGTSTDAIARRAGVSQPYVFQLFGTKKELFIAVVRTCFAKTTRQFQAAGRAARTTSSDPAIILAAMGTAYAELVADRTMLLVQLHAYAACGDPEIRDIVRDEFTRLFREIARLSGADDASLDRWFAFGMLCNVATAVGLGNMKEFSLGTLARGVAGGEPSE